MTMRRPWATILLVILGCSDDGGDGQAAETGATTTGVTTGVTTGAETTGGMAAELEEAKLLVEHNATLRDTGFQGFADGEPWNELVCVDPNGDSMLRATAGDALVEFGLTEFFFATSEPANADEPMDGVLALLPAGGYRYSAQFVDDVTGARTAELTKDIPAGPVLLGPTDGTTGLDPNAVIITWEPVTQSIDGTDLAIVGYEVVVEQDAPLEFPQTFSRPVMSVHLPADAAVLTVPVGFLVEDACYKYEVLAIEESGNQTLSSAEFQTGMGCTAVDEPAPDEPVLTIAKLIVEHNATDLDTGFQAFADGDPWNQLVVETPDGTVVATVAAEGRLVDFGFTELFFETSEPPNAEVPMADVLALLPEGEYVFRGMMVGGGSDQITATFTHEIPEGATITSPAAGAEDVNPDATVVSWDPVTGTVGGDPVTIVGYQVIVEEDVEPEFLQAFAKPVFDIHLPMSATSVMIPPEFLKSGTDYTVEVLAIERSGNQTISSLDFATR